MCYITLLEFEVLRLEFVEQACFKKIKYTILRVNVSEEAEIRIVVKYLPPGHRIRIPNKIYL